ncbi:hypothetical protein [Actinoplanes derwentensis]|uniref:Uncharacterized protein n=1 Tax=Actinoplanes derwentensis TaxID=113562 RepID=A0A1H1X657_9ACTN|nr:hypothetical protein [Actinoplanes derwentensis]GID85710.1 hypothetical protein Ade03nite_46340 [Actinoplanes derwentensis]SDT04551.1 hypothetical protein SAMN04489716_2348 [Actinoplanes derwentensis]
MRTVADLFDEHRRAAFPSRLKYDDVNGVEMVGVDVNVSGCVGTWLENGGRLDDRRWNTLAECEQRLIRVIPALGGEDALYCRRLLAMTVLILENPDDAHHLVHRGLC